MPNFFFIRHGQLQAPYHDHQKMDYNALTALSKGVADPGINRSSQNLFLRQTKKVDFSHVRKIFFNNSGFHSRRSLESAKIIQFILQKKLRRRIPCIGMPELGEVRFDVSRLVSRKEFSESGMMSVRKALYKAQLQNSVGIESVRKIKKRVEKISAIVAQQKNDTIFVTHDFLMRYIELFIRQPRRLVMVSKKRLLQTHYNHYFAGFFTNEKKRRITYWGK